MATDSAVGQVAFFVCELSGEITAVNRGGEGLLGLTTNVPGTIFPRFQDIYSSSSRSESVEAVFKHLMMHQEPFSEDRGIIKTIAGDSVEVALLLRREDGLTGRPIRFSGVLWAREKEKEKEKIWRVSLGHFFHGFNNSIFSIDALLEKMVTILNQTQPENFSPQIQERLQMARSEVSKIKDVVRTFRKDADPFLKSGEQEN